MIKYQKNGGCEESNTSATDDVTKISKIKQNKHVEVAELVDAHDSGSCG